MGYLNNMRDHFLPTFLLGLALSTLDSLLLKLKTLNLSKSVNCALLVCLANDLPILLSLNTF